MLTIILTLLKFVGIATSILVLYRFLFSWANRPTGHIRYALGLDGLKMENLHCDGAIVKSDTDNKDSA